MKFKKDNLSQFLRGFTDAGGGLKGVVDGVKALILSFGKLGPVIAVATAALAAFGIASAIIDSRITTADEAKEKLNNTKSEFEDTQSTIESMNTELETTRDRINELNAKEHLTFTEQEELTNLQLQNSELERSLELEEARAKVKAKQLLQDSYDTYKKLTENDLTGKVDNKFDENEVDKYYEDLSTLRGNGRLIKIGNVSEDDNINYLLASLKAADDEMASIVDQQNQLTDKYGDEYKDLQALYEQLEAKKVDIQGYIDDYVSDISDIYVNYQNAMAQGVELEDYQREQYDEIKGFLSQFSKLYQTGADDTVEKINSIFAKVKFDGLESKLLSAAKNGREALVDIIPDNFKKELETAGVDIDNFISHIMALANPKALMADEIRKQLRLDYAGKATSIDTAIRASYREGQLNNVLKDATDEQIIQFNNYLKNNGYDISLWDDEDTIRKHFEIATEVTGDVEEVKLFSDLLKEDKDSPENLTEYVDKYKTEFSSIQTILDNIKSGEYTLLDSAEMIGSVPELAGHTNSLEEIKKTLNDLSYDKLAEFVDGYQTYISKLTDPAEIEAAREYMKAIVNTVTLDGMDFDYNAFYSNLADGIDNLGSSRQGAASKTIQQVWDEFGGTEDGREILATLSLNPDAASWTYEQWAEEIENKEVYIKLKLREEERKLLESQISDIQAKGDLIDARNSAKEESGYRLTREDYEASVSNKEAEIAKRQSERAISINERSELDRNAENYASEKARLDAEITQATLEIFNLRQEINGLNEDIENIPKVEIEGRIELKELEADGLKAQIDKLEEEGKVIPKSLRQYYMSSQSDLVAYNTILENILQNQIDTFEGDKTSDAYIGLVSALQAVQEASANATKEVDAQWKVMENSPLTILSKELSDLEAQASELEDTLSFKESAGLKVVASDYEKLVSNSKLQVVNLVNTNKELNDEMDAFIASNGDINSEEYKDLEQQVIANESAIRSATLSQIEWNKTIQNLPITQIQELSSAISTALTETNEATGVSIETMDTIRMQFSDIEDMDVEDLFYSTADGVKISTKKLKDFAKAENKIVRARFDKEIEDQKDAIEDYQNEIGAGKVDSKLRDLQNNLEGIMDRQAAYFAQYQEQMESISKYAEIEIAENTPNQGAKYDAMQGRLESWKDMYDKGLWGTDDFQKIGEYFNEYGFGDYESFEKDYAKATRYITEDATGLQRFFTDLEAKGLATYQTLADGSEELVLTYKDAADAARIMDIGEEFFVDMLGKVEEYGGIVTIVDSLEDSALQTSELNQELYEAQKKLIDLKETGADSAAIEKQEGIISGIRDQIKDVQEVTDNYIVNQNEDFTSGFMNVKSRIAEYKKHYKAALAEGNIDIANQWLDDIQAEADKYGLELNLDTLTVNESWQEIYDNAVGERGTWEVPITPVLDESSKTTYDSTYQKLFSAFEEGNPALKEASELLSGFTFSELEQIDLFDGQYVSDNLREAEDALDGLTASLGLSNEEAQMLVTVLEAAGVLAPTIQLDYEETEEAKTGLEVLKNLQKVGIIDAEVDLEADTANMSIEELDERLERLRNIEMNVRPGTAAYEEVLSLINDAEIEKTIRFVAEQGYSISDLVNMSEEEVEQLSVELGVDTAQIYEAIGELESQEIGMTVKIAESQFQQLVDVNPIDSEAANEEINSVKENLATLPGTAKDNEAEILVNTDEATSKISDINAKFIMLNKANPKPKVDLLGVDNAIQKINTIMVKLDRLATRRVNVPVSVNSSYSAPANADTVADGTLHGAYADGTAFNMLNLRAYAGGTNVGLKRDETALVNEEGTEGLIREGKLYEIPGGMHTQALKRGDIILSVKQMQQLKETGKASGHGKRYGAAYADGTLHGMSAYGDSSVKVKLPKESKVNPNNTDAKKSQTATNNNTTALKAHTDATKDNTKATEDQLKAFDDYISKLKDWIEVLIQRNEESKELNLTKADNQAKATDKNEYVDRALTDVKDLIEANMLGAVEYEAQAKKVKNKAVNKKLITKEQANEIIPKIHSGNIKIEEYDEGARKFIEEYSEWYDKAQACKQAVEDLKLEQKELAQTKFDNIATEYDNLIGRIEHTGNLLNTAMENQELKGHITSARYYQALINNTKDSQLKLIEKQKDLEASLEDAVASGKIEEGSTEWYEMQGEIDGVIEKIKEADNEILKYQNDIRKTNWEIEDMKHEAVTRLTDEGDFLIELLSNNQLFDDKGNITNDGMAVSGLNMMNYEIALDEAKTYADEWKALQKQIKEKEANGDYDLNLINRANEVRDAWQNASLSVDKYAEAIRDLKDKEFQAQLDALKELSDKYMDVLKKQKDMRDYQDEVSEKTADISRLEKMKLAYSRDTSEEGRLKRQQVDNDLEEARKALEETQYDRFIADQEEILTDLEMQTQEFFEARLLDITSLLAEAGSDANANQAAILGTIQSEVQTVGADITTELKTIWDTKGPIVTEIGGATTAITDQGALIVTAVGGVKTELGKLIGQDGAIPTASGSINTSLGNQSKDFDTTFNNKEGSIYSVLDGIRKKIEDYKKKSDEEGKKGVKESGGNDDPNYDPNQGKNNGNDGKNDGNTVKNVGDKIDEEDKLTLPTVNLPKTNAPKSKQGDGKIQVGDKVTFTSGRYYENSYGQGNSGYHNRGKKVYITKIHKGNPYPYHISTGKKLGKGDLGWLKKSQLKGYASGIDKVKEDEWAITQEKGREIIALPDGSIMAPLKKGSGVINNAKTEQLLSLANNHDAIMDMMDTTNKLNQAKLAEQIQGYVDAICGLTQHVNNSMSSGSANYNGDIIINLPNVQKPEDFMNWLRNNSKAQHDLQDVVFSEVMGKGKLSTRKK